MTDIIPRDLIRHLEYNPNMEVSPQEVQEQPRKGFSIEDIINGKTFYGDIGNPSAEYSSGVEALKEAFGYAGSEGIIATMPELIEARNKCYTYTNSYFWNETFTSHTEENVGIDTKGRFYGICDPVLVIVNGGGLITPERIEQLPRTPVGITGEIMYKNEEFDELLEGKLPDGNSIPLICFEDIKQGITNLPHRFGVVMPYNLAAKTPSGKHNKKDFIENPLVIARAGGQEHLEEYFEKLQISSMGNYHNLEARRSPMPTGRLIEIKNFKHGMDDNFNPRIFGRFLGVAPK